MGKKISNIVFTKNRPLQLEAYLRSLYRYLPREIIQTYIIYKSALFCEQYEEVFREFAECVIIKEGNFHEDFVELIERINSRYILFGTDDVVYFDSVDFALIDDVFGRFGEQIFGFSLRLDPVNLQQEQEQICQIKIDGRDLYRLNWKSAASRNGKYPFELNSTIYRTELVKKIVAHVAKEHLMLKRVFRQNSLRVRVLGRLVSMKDFLILMSTFRDPNSLEGHCYRWCKKHKWKVPSYLYFQKLCASAIQVNRVNTAVGNPIDGSREHTVEALSEAYKQGYRFDIEAIEKNKPRATHVGKEYFRLTRRPVS